MKLLGTLLSERNQPFEVLAIGGGALLLLGLSQRATRAKDGTDTFVDASTCSRSSGISACRSTATRWTWTMGDDRAGEPLLDVVWSLWSELGVPGPRRVLGARSPMVFSWCTQHGSRLSGSRSSALARRAHPDVRIAAEAFLAQLATAGVALVRVEPVSAARPRSHREMPVTSERPALLRLRMRALVGVGGRADLLVALLSAPDAWVSASFRMDEVGLAKRHVARILAELADGNLAHDRQRGNVREFQLSNPGALADLVALPPDAVFPPCGAIFEWSWACRRRHPRTRRRRRSWRGRAIRRG